ncbi:ankyrin repeat protein, putative [Trichomonas vaginalis G3]|uniref:Ankyrin repeat protein, putative n=1 Tax=Trichomonas vaginalis (strain ATCC PRA-98 / G3) TaxID=412133 RepID=A2FZU9_TRIV3|nr:ankyrin repeat and SOCS box-containing protein 4 family [Trichomonas vaginalis G3]EAX89571.1 ankyrin repeat protein, putative [Trichomonas vaginalis G3]KAI5507555.1 ankyrin repeat and SOCS box-containing protein 4 family [Trichomonas vaginalis G3]|eukprot:XP_001302501.1 ankyrin repeat protein [Trichomonas vaginalis G3]
MSESQSLTRHYDVLLHMCNDYIDTFNSLYSIKSNTEEKINQIYEKIKNNLLENKLFSPEDIYDQIQIVCIYRIGYLRAYWEIFKKIYNEYGINHDFDIDMKFAFLLYKEYNFIWDTQMLNEFHKMENKKFSVDIFPENSTDYAIMEDSVEKLIQLTENRQDFKYLKSIYYPERDEYSIPEICCFQGAVNCFKLFLSKSKFKVTQNCINFAFLSGNPDILNICLKEMDKRSDVDLEPCMKYAIISHNIDFVSYLVTEEELDIDIDMCLKYKNLQVFLIYFDQNNSIEKVNLNKIRECTSITPLFGIPSLVEYFISNGGSIDSKYKQNRSILHYAIINNWTELANILIAEGANVNTRDKEECTPLHYAAENGCTEIIKYLISKGANVNAQDKNKRTPLHFAAMQKSIETLKFLIEKGSDVNAKDVNGFTPLLLAIKNNNLEITKILLQNRANPNDINNDGQTSLQIAATHGGREIIELLLSHGCIINEREYLIHCAATNNIFGTLEFVIGLHNNVNIRNSDDKTPLHIAAENGSIENIRTLIFHGADIDVHDKEGNTPLHLAVGNEMVAKFLIENGANINSVNEKGQTPILYADFNYKINFLKYYISKGAYVNQKDLKGKTLFHYAAEGKYHEIIRTLISLGADINAKDNDGNTPLHCSVKKLHEKTTDFLICNFADINARNNKGQTPLHIASMYKNYQLIELLKSRNADESIMDNNGKTADDYIIIYEDTDLSDAMRENGECRIN